MKQIVLTDHSHHRPLALYDVQPRLRKQIIHVEEKINVEIVTYLLIKLLLFLKKVQK